jgi:hypothetical protein
MAKTVLDMSMSLDRFISGPQDDAAHPMGLDASRVIHLHYRVRQKG